MLPGINSLMVGSGGETLVINDYIGPAFGADTISGSVSKLAGANSLIVELINAGGVGYGDGNDNCAGGGGSGYIRIKGQGSSFMTSLLPITYTLSPSRNLVGGVYYSQVSLYEWVFRAYTDTYGNPGYTETIAGPGLPFEYMVSRNGGSGAQTSVGQSCGGGGAGGFNSDGSNGLTTGIGGSGGGGLAGKGGNGNVIPAQLGGNYGGGGGASTASVNYGGRSILRLTWGF